MAGPEFALPAPAGYSHVVSIPAGRLVWTSGQLGTDAAGNIPKDFGEEARAAFANVDNALRAGGAGWSDVVKLTLFVRYGSDVEPVREARDECVDTARPPTSSLVFVSRFVDYKARIEVEAVAWLP